MDKAYFEQKKQEIKEFKKQMEKEGKQFFLQISKELFEENPTLIKFGCRQYTPYFNDGDPCVFRCVTDYPNLLIEGEAEEEFDEERWFDDEGKKTPAAKIYKKVTKFLTAFDDDDLEMMFGDHCSVVVTRDGVEVEEYDHD